MMRWLRLMFIGLCAGGAAGILAQGSEPLGQAEDIVTVETVLSWIERYQRIDAENAELLRQSLDRRADRVARLELALLEIHAPSPVGEPMRGLERLNVLVDAAEDASNAGWVTADAKRMLVLFLDQAQTIQSLRQQSEANAGRLERERRAHLDTLEKLDALRSIERDLEQRQSSEEAAEPEEGEDPDDDPNSARQWR